VRKKEKIKVIFEDDFLFVIDKPSGWVVNESKTTKKASTIQSWLRTKTYSLAKSREMRSGIVHRLDKETSGLLLVAKKPKAFKNLQAQFKARRVKKTYLALVHGKLEPKTGMVRVPIARLPWHRERFGVLPGGKRAQTSYKVLEFKTRDGQNYSLVEFYPKTGRTHQIRVHAKYLGHPIVADEFYAGRKRARSDRAWCPRLFLHASQISFRHPISGERISFKSHLPENLEKL
jgi:23S rRNA pseudouridine1911/1915/1917 synthase